MSYWMFTVTTHKSDGETFPAEDIFRQRMSDKFWGLGEKTPNRTSLQKGDKVVFYIGLPTKAFAGCANLASNSWKLSEEERDQVSHGKKFYRPEYGVRLEQTQVWDSQRLVESILPQLKFIENKEYWFAYFQGGVRQISEEDFRAITLSAGPFDGARQPNLEDMQSTSEFALESHLEEFMDSNWESIDFGAKLVRYQSEEQTGRQFPAGPWSIDFLCVDKGTGDFVVLELKRGKTSDATVGQVLRYMSWVRQNLAKDGQRVRGIIVASKVDDALKYAVQDLENVRVSTYRVDFKLSPSKK
jgi:predicted RNA-binding protein